MSPCPHLAAWPTPATWMWGWECFPLCPPHPRCPPTVPVGCVVSALTAPSPRRVRRPGRLPAQVLQRPGSAHEGGGHVWVLPACMCCDLPMVGVDMDSPWSWRLGSPISSLGEPVWLHLPRKRCCPHAAQPGGPGK